MSLLEALRALGAKGPVVPVVGVQPRPPVGHSRELERILALPWHPGYSDAEREAVADALRVDGGSMKLRPHQADALLAALDARGLFAPLSVGAGKTLIAALLPSMFPEVARPVILTTAALAKQAAKMIAEYRRHFAIRSDLEIVPYSTLSRPDASALLEDLSPGLVIADEAHALRDKDSARTKRFLRYMKAHPGTIFCALSGTMTKRSVKDYSTLIGLALRDWTPLPRDWPTLTEWAEALDPEPVRHFGALARLKGSTWKNATRTAESDAGANSVNSPCIVASGDGSAPLLAEVREAFARRVASTRGVVSSPGEELGASLVIRIVRTPEVPEIKAARLALARTWERPDGEELTTAMEVAAVDRQLRLGGCYLWAEPPHPEWLRARREWHRAVRTWLRGHAREGCDSPALLQTEIVLGHASDFRKLIGPDLAVALRTWQAADWKYPEPPRVWRWISTGIVESTAVHLDARVVAPTCAFADLIEPGRAMAEEAELEYYGGGPEDAARILDEDGSRSIVCSLQAHGQGRNLQMFARALVLGGPPSGAAWEQLFGRLHRSGQTADEVEYLVLDLFADELQRAIEDARYLAASTGQPQKLLQATIIREEAT